MSDRRLGVALALAAYGSWGVLPLFWRQLAHVPAAQILLHRITWAMVSLVLIAVVRREWPEMVRLLRDRKQWPTLLASSALVGVNWFTFVYAVETDRVLQASLGYFINPLVNVVLGMAFLGERLRRVQWIAVGLAAVGVLQLALRSPEVPWIALLLAGAFGTYGLVRKRGGAPPLAGTAAETVILCGPCVIAIVGLEFRGQGFAWVDPQTTTLLVVGGFLTALPLWWFTSAARRLRLTTMGFLQYLAPTLHFILAVVVFGEPFGTIELLGFGLIWTAVAVFGFEQIFLRPPEPAPTQR
jgi:chloramphenicol-sensitive protein RarD